MRDLIGITYDALSSGPELTAAEWRQVEAGLFLRDTNDLVIGGVRGGAVSNTGFSATIAPLTAVIHPSQAIGVYQTAFPSGASELAKTIPAAHATLARIDAVDVKFFDHEADGSGTRGADIQMNQGTAGSGSAPSFTGVGHRLGTFAVPASGGGNPVWTPNPNLIGYAAAGGMLDIAGHPSNPRAGTAIYNRTTGGMEYYNGTAWVPLVGAILAEASDTTDLLALSNTTFTAGSPVCGDDFIAPPSGKIKITTSAHIEQNSAGGFAYLSFEIRTGNTLGSGSVVQIAVTDYGVGSSARVSASRAKTLGGLTPGAAYNIRTMHVTTAAGATGYDVFYREVTVEAA